MICLQLAPISEYNAEFEGSKEKKKKKREKKIAYEERFVKALIAYVAFAGSSKNIAPRRASADRSQVFTLQALLSIEPSTTR